MSDYFSDREKGPKPRAEETISSAAWGGLVALTRSLIATGAFGFEFPELCPDGEGISGTDENALSLAVQAEMPGLDWPPLTPVRLERGFSWEEQPFVPDTLPILDFIEFCHDSLAKPIRRGYHSFFRHHHLSFDPDAGREEYRESVNRIFARNGIAYDLQESAK